jgi:Cu+-exporting ATPase
MVRDPVCGMDIDEKAAAAIRQLHGQAVYFCSDACVMQYDADPGRYGGRPSQDIGSATTGARPSSLRLVRIELPVLGMTCAKCVATVERALREEPGVARATVNLNQQRAFVTYDPAVTRLEHLTQALRQAGYQTGASTTLRVQGIYCAGCIPQIEDALQRTPGVLAATLNPATEDVRVEYLPSVTDLKALRAAVAAAGPYTAVEPPGPSSEAMDQEAVAQEHDYRSLMRKWWFGAADECANIEQQIRDAKTPAHHQAIVAFYDKEAKEAHQLHAKHLAMKDAYAKIPALQEKARAADHCDAIARKYQEMAKEYQTLAAMHKTMAEQLK